MAEGQKKLSAVGVEEREKQGDRRTARRRHLKLTSRIALQACRELAGSFLLCLMVLTVVIALVYLPGWRGEIGRQSALSRETFLAEAGERWTEEELGQQWGRRLWQRLTWAVPAWGDTVPWAVADPAGGTRLIPLDMRDANRAWITAALAVLLADLLRMIRFFRHRWRLNRLVITPVRRLTELTDQISAGNLSDRIDEDGFRDEYLDLVRVINGMLGRIERSYNSQKQFVSDASHELRTPIAVIQGYANLLRRWGREDPAVLEESLEAISRETDSMKELVENLLFLARHDKRTMMLEMSRFDPNELLREVLRETELVHPEDHFAAETTAPVEMEGDRNLIKQVLRILVDNAVKYTPQGGHITLGAAMTGEGLVLSVQDDGAGIAPEDLPKIFDRFYRADAARSSETGGFGLGLSIARIIVVAHGGKLRVRSKVGEGSVFEVVLPERDGGTEA